MNNNESKSLIPTERIEKSIYVIRGHKVILDQDLAALYGVETKALNRVTHRNQKRFPEDFAFQITIEEWNSLRYQIGTSNIGRGGRRYLPMVFTEHGVVMAANLLKSDRAVEVSVEIVRAFIKLREFLSSKKEITKELIDLKSFLLKHSNSNDREFKKVWDAIEKLSQPLKEKNESQPRIGFKLDN